ncbi:helix-turn-helix transcriptional regulator [Streptomyces sp. NPDC003857]
MPRNPQYSQPAPPGYVWADEASRLTGLSIETLYKYRQRGIGPRSGKVGRNVAWPVDGINAWLEAQMNEAPTAQQLHDSRPAEPRLAARRRKAAPIAA